MRADQHTPPDFDVAHALEHLRHFLPAQAPLKDFIHHNTLHAFQDKPFFEAIGQASVLFGYKVFLGIEEYRQLFAAKRISAQVLDRVLQNAKGSEAKTWEAKLLTGKYNEEAQPRVGQLRAAWKRDYKIDLDLAIHGTLFRLLCSYLDQGIAIWPFPIANKGFLDAIKDLERGSFTSLFRSKRARQLLFNADTSVESLLQIVVGDSHLYSQYLFDQQFAHQGWSGIAAMIETMPETLMDRRNISLHDIVLVELLLEIDALDARFGSSQATGWKPLAQKLSVLPEPLFGPVPHTELAEVYALWQSAYEWSYYDQVLAGVQQEPKATQKIVHQTFQAMFCMDDRECSLRRYIENTDPHAETFGTPGFFNVEFYYQPEHGKAYSKVCPAPMFPHYLIKEVGTTSKRQQDATFGKRSHNLLSGWLVSQTLGFWAALRLAGQIFRPSSSPATTSSFKHMDVASKLTIENTDPGHIENGLQIGFTIAEMATRVEGLLKSIGLVRNFAPIVYVVGHGASSVNNTHYAGYDCGACSGRPGSVNARVICHMANSPKVRALLLERGIDIPENTDFLGALHDTTRDEIQFFDELSLSVDNLEAHKLNKETFERALDLNAKERSRRFDSIDTSLSLKTIHNKIRTRAVSLFEPRPELNHATNALFFVGRRALTKGLFLDRRSFMNSYDYSIDPEGNYLFNILKAAAPVGGGINLEYYFSRTDNQKLGAGTKLPHNVMGLIGVANGADGDLRPGLPLQMIEVHDPLRLLIIVEHEPEVVLDVIRRHEPTHQWFINDWVLLVAVQPETKKLFQIKNDTIVPYLPLKQELGRVADIEPLLESTQENFPVYLLS